MKSLQEYVIGYATVDTSGVEMFRVSAQKPLNAIMRVLKDKGWDVEVDWSRADELGQLTEAADILKHFHIYDVQLGVIKL
jgi:pyruvate/oxaloacetate carboxyltransferase